MMKTNQLNQNFIQALYTQLYTLHTIRSHSLGSLLMFDVFSAQAVLGHDDCVTAMLEHKASALCRDAQGSTPLHYAASRGHTEILASLVQAAITTDPQDKLLDNKQYTPLHWAAYKGWARPATRPSKPAVCSGGKKHLSL